MNNTIGVVAHTARQEQAQQLANLVDAQYVSIDDGTLGCELNHRKVWLWHIENTTTQWAINLEDDAIPVEGFKEQAEQALTAAPSYAHIVSLYLGRHHLPHLEWEQRKQHALTHIGDAHWLTSNTLLHAVAVAIRTDILPQVIAHTMRLPDFIPNDEAITHFAINTGATIAYCIPSLIDHADQPTLFRHYDKLERPPGRVAYQTGIRANWTSKAVSM